MGTFHHVGKGHLGPKKAPRKKVGPEGQGGNVRIRERASHRHAEEEGREEAVSELLRVGRRRLTQRRDVLKERPVILRGGPDMAAVRTTVVVHESVTARHGKKDGRRVGWTRGTTGWSHVALQRRIALVRATALCGRAQEGGRSVRPSEGAEQLGQPIMGRDASLIGFHGFSVEQAARTRPVHNFLNDLQLIVYQCLDCQTQFTVDGPRRR